LPAARSILVASLEILALTASSCGTSSPPAADARTDAAQLDGGGTRTDAAEDVDGRAETSMDLALRDTSRQTDAIDGAGDAPRTDGPAEDRVTEARGDATNDATSAPVTIYTIVLSKLDYAEIVGSSNASYLNSLIASYGLATNYDDSGLHPSLPNRPEMISGDGQYPPSSI
jgi:hypothetical protein